MLVLDRISEEKEPTRLNKQNLWEKQLATPGALACNLAATCIATPSSAAAAAGGCICTGHLEQRWKRLGQFFEEECSGMNWAGKGPKRWKNVCCNSLF